MFSHVVHTYILVALEQRCSIELYLLQAYSILQANWCKVTFMYRYFLFVILFVLTHKQSPTHSTCLSSFFKDGSIVIASKQ